MWVGLVLLPALPLAPSLSLLSLFHLSVMSPALIFLGNSSLLASISSILHTPSLSCRRFIICGHWFRNTSHHRVSNAIDVLQHKLKQGPNRAASSFPAYTRPAQDFAAVVEFFRQQFVAQAVAKKGAVFTHLTCGRDTRMLETALSAVLHKVLEQQLAGWGCLLLDSFFLALREAAVCESQAGLSVSSSLLSSISGISLLFRLFLTV